MREPGKLQPVKRKIQNKDTFIYIKVNRMSKKEILMLNISNILGEGNSIATTDIAV